MKNRIAKIVKENQIDIFEEEISPLEDGKILIKLKAVGICGSDLHYFRHCGLGSFKNPLPIHIGHEPSGIVIESKSPHFKEGDHVAIEPGLNCGKCKYCHKGLYNLCINTIFLGANDIGAFRDYIALEPERLMKIENISFEKGALLEPIGVALHAVDFIDALLGDTIGVFGAGTIGLCISAVLKKKGLKVAIFDPLQYRLDFAKDVLQLDETHINNDSVNLSKKYAAVVDAVGTQDSLNKSIKCADVNATVCIVGIPEVDLLTINPHQMRTKQIVLKNSRRSNQKIEKSYELFQDDQSIDKLVTHKFLLDDIQKAFEVASNYQDGVIKAMIVE